MNPSRTSDRDADAPRWRPSAIGLALGAALLVCVLYLAFMVYDLSQEPVRLSRADFERQLAKLRAGETKIIHFYTTSNSNAFLKQLEGKTEVEELNFELADVSDAGMESVASLPRLRKLVIHGGRPSVTDRGLAALSAKQSLEALELINTQVTDDGLRVLKDLPNLRDLVIFCEPRLGVHLTDAGLVHLKDLPKLKSISLTGGWASPAAIAKLRESLPNCKFADDDESGKTSRR